MTKIKHIQENEEFIAKGIVFTWYSDEAKIVFKPIRKHDKAVKVSKTFNPPTQQEVTKYFVDNGYSKELAKTFFDGYQNGEPPWHDSRGNPVRAWKQKAIQVWFKPEAKVKQEITSFFQE